jgi:hypothetical protein
MRSSSEVEIAKLTEALERRLRVIGTEVAGLVEDIATIRREGMTMETGEARAWLKVAELEGQTYSWPPERGGIEEYDPFDVYESDGYRLGIGVNVRPVTVKARERKHIWVFEMKADDRGKRPVVPFISDDDYERTGELVSLIRGKGPKKRQMFAPGDALPPGYEKLRIDHYPARISGHYDRLCVVAHETDVNSMLEHAVAQLRWKRR